MPYLGLITLAVLILTLIDIIRAEEGAIHGIPKLAWIMLVVVIPIIGALLWIGFGRPTADDIAAEPARPRGEFPEYDHPHRARAVDPDADREFLRQVRARAEEQRRKAREQQQRGTDEQTPGT
ncbi:MAG: PLD nuclease N-terminal domain-containing protein [Gordonia amarae]